ncbi:MAG: hypothetical protein ACI9K2_001484 [Myxococcota bacterium]|jgi:hypothetical protein
MVSDAHRRRSRAVAPSIEPAPTVGPARAPEAEVAASVHDAFGNTEVGAALAAPEGLRGAVAGALEHAVHNPGVAHGPLASNRAMQRVLRERRSGGSAIEATTLQESGGASLAPDQRERFEQAMDEDFGQVRVHTDGQAAKAARALAAHAFSIGAHVWFGAGEFAPGTPAGDRLLAHELTHVVQHAEGRIPAPDGPGLQVSSPGDALEREAYANEGVVLSALAESADEAPASSGAVASMGTTAASETPALAADGTVHRYKPPSGATADKTTKKKKRRRKRQQKPVSAKRALALNRALQLPLDFIRRLRVALLGESLDAQGNTHAMDAALTLAVAGVQRTHTAEPDTGTADDFAYADTSGLGSRPLGELGGAIDGRTFRLLEALPGMAFRLLGDHTPAAGSAEARIVPAGTPVEARWVFYRNLIRARGGVFLEGPGELNLLSIRGARKDESGAVVQTGGAGAFKRAYAKSGPARNPSGASPTGASPAAAGTGPSRTKKAEKGAKHFSGKQGFDDLVISIWVQREGARLVPRVSERAGSVDPAGASDKNKGAAHLMDGQTMQTLRTHGTSGGGHQTAVLSQIFGKRAGAPTARTARSARWRAARLKARLLKTATATYAKVPLSAFVAGLHDQAAKVRVTQMWRLLNPEYKKQKGRLRLNYTALREARKVLYARQPGDTSTAFGTGRRTAHRTLGAPVINVHSGGVDWKGRDFVSSWGCTNLKGADFPAFLQEITAASNAKTARKGAGGIPYTLVDASKVPRMTEADTVHRWAAFGQTSSEGPSTPAKSGPQPVPDAVQDKMQQPDTATQRAGGSDQTDATGGVGPALLDLFEELGSQDLPAQSALQGNLKRRGKGKRGKAAFDPATDARTSSGVTVTIRANYDKNKRRGHAYFKSQAETHAKTTLSAAVAGRRIRWGQATAVDNAGQLTTRINAIGKALKNEATSRGEAGPKPPAWTTIRNLSIFAHGDDQALSTNTVNTFKGTRALKSSDAASFVSGIGGVLGSTVNIQLYSCNAGRDITHRDSLTYAGAKGIRSALAAEAGSAAGKKAVKAFKKANEARMEAEKEDALVKPPPALAGKQLTRKLASVRRAAASKAAAVARRKWAGKSLVELRAELGRKKRWRSADPRENFVHHGARRILSDRWEGSYDRTKGRHGGGSLGDALSKALHAADKKGSVFAHGVKGPTTDNYVSKVFGDAAGAGKGGVHLFTRMFPIAVVENRARTLYPAFDELDAAGRAQALERVRRWMWQSYRGAIVTNHGLGKRDKWYSPDADGGMGALMFHDPAKAAKMMQIGFDKRVAFAEEALLKWKGAWKWLAARPWVRGNPKLATRVRNQDAAVGLWLRDHLMDRLTGQLRSRSRRSISRMVSFGDVADNGKRRANAIGKLLRAARGKVGKGMRARLLGLSSVTATDRSPTGSVSGAVVASLPKQNADRLFPPSQDPNLPRAGRGRAAPVSAGTGPLGAHAGTPTLAAGPQVVLASLRVVAAELDALLADATERQAPGPVRDGLRMAAHRSREAADRLEAARRGQPAAAAEALVRARAVLRDDVAVAKRAYEGWVASETHDPTADVKAPAVADRVRNPQASLPRKKLARAVTYNAGRPLTSAQWELVHTTVGLPKASRPSEATANALFAWQAAHGDARADGWLGPATWRNLLLIHLGAKQSTGGWETTVPKPGKGASPTTASVAKTVAAIRTARASISDRKKVRRRTKGKRLLGYVYTASGDKVGAALYRKWLGGATPSDKDLRNSKTRKQWELFQDTAKGEGDPSSMNTWDDQDVTLGAGFSAAGQLQRVLAGFFTRAPSAMRRFYEAGILLNGSTFVAVDVAKNVRLEGDAAKKLIKYDKTLITLFIDLAQSTERDDGLGNTDKGPTLRQHMLDAQFSLFQDKAGNVPTFALSWSRTARAVAGHANHWLPGVYPWSRFKSTKGDLAKIAAVFGQCYVKWRVKATKLKNTKALAKDRNAPQLAAPKVAPARLHRLLKGWGGAEMRSAFPAASTVADEALDPAKHVYLSAGKAHTYYVFDRP